MTRPVNPLSASAARAPKLAGAAQLQRTKIGQTVRDGIRNRKTSEEPMALARPACQGSVPASSVIDHGANASPSRAKSGEVFVDRPSTRVCNILAL